jgi:hypothetical protein
MVGEAPESPLTIHGAIARSIVGGWTGPNSRRAVSQRAPSTFALDDENEVPGKNCTRRVRLGGRVCGANGRPLQLTVLC